jgi:hypothetical protein
MARKKRDRPLSYRPPAAKREEFASRVASSGLSLNAFITAAVFGQAAPRARRKSQLDRQLLASLLVEAAIVSDRLPGVAAATPEEQAAAINACREELSEIRTCLMQLLGREP